MVSHSFRQWDSLCLPCTNPWSCVGRPNCRLSPLIILSCLTLEVSFLSLFHYHHEFSSAILLFPTPFSHVKLSVAPFCHVNQVDWLITVFFPVSFTCIEPLGDNECRCCQIHNSFKKVFKCGLVVNLAPPSDHEVHSSSKLLCFFPIYSYQGQSHLNHDSLCIIVAVFLPRFPIDHAHHGGGKIVWGICSRKMEKSLPY